MRLNRDVIVAIVLLLLCGTFFAATYSIRETSYGTVGSELWPRIILVFLTVFTVIYLFNSLRLPADASTRDSDAPRGIAGFFATYRNAIICFACFAVFLATLDYLGMLLGGILFVFAALSLIGDRTVRAMGLHGAIAILSVGAMWAIFTFALRVILPEGELLRIW